MAIKTSKLTLALFLILALIAISAQAQMNNDSNGPASTTNEKGEEVAAAEATDEESTAPAE